MKKSNQIASVITNEEISESIYRIKIKGNFSGNPGQFYMLRAWEGIEPFLSRPLSIFNLENDYIEFLYEDRGKGTNLLSKLQTNDKISLLGPLGNEFKVNGDKIAIVSGGIGIAPVAYLAKKTNAKIDFYCGFRDEVYILDYLEKYVDNIYISTDTGKHGIKGFITDIIDYNKYDEIFTCGPEIMMRKVSMNHEEVVVSMERRMACGIGACMGCNIETSNGNKKVCKDGPVFHSKEVFI